LMDAVCQTAAEGDREGVKYRIPGADADDAAIACHTHTRVGIIIILYV